MAHSPSGISVIPSDTQIGKTKNNSERGSQGFGSSDTYWVQEIKRNRPDFHLKINGKWFQGILDTGADVSCIADKYWPSKWPTQYTSTELKGIGQAQAPQQSSDLLSWCDGEGHRGFFRPFIIPGLPVNLWGRDIMSKMGVYLYSPSPQVAQQMFDQGLLPGQGLGIEGQGRQEPVSPAPNSQRAGLGYFPRGS